MSRDRKHGSYFGLTLIIIGLLFLFNSFGFWHFHWSQILVVMGIFFCAAAFTGHDRGPIFPGAIVLLLGLFFLLREYDILDDPMYYMWPVFLIIVGSAFLLLFIFRPEEWGLMIPGGVLILLGLLFLAYNYDIFGYNPWRLVRDYWPIILVLIGIKMLLDSRQGKYHKEPEPEKLSETVVEIPAEKPPASPADNPQS